MIYAEIQPGQKVQIMVGKRPEGVVVDKRADRFGQETVSERVWVDTDRGRRICSPSVLREVT